MSKYHKIDTVFKRDPETKHKRLILGDYSIPEFKYLAGNEWVWTEKVDGTNIRIMLSPYGELVFGGKTDDAQLYAPLVARLQELFLPQKLFMQTMFPEGVTLYGEGYGARIQKGGGNYLPHVDFVLFDVKIGYWWLQRDAVHEIGKKLGLMVVPIIGAGTLPDMVDFVRSGFKSWWGDFFAEGVVARPRVELRDRANRRIITKLKHKDFDR